MASSNDRVTYDVFYDWEGKPNRYPYRSEALYDPDVKALYRALSQRNRLVQVIHTHGDSHWTDAVYVREEDADPEYGITRFVVEIDGKEHMVSRDRIRPRP
jgi:hypothetical protein